MGVASLLLWQLLLPRHLLGTQSFDTRRLTRECGKDTPNPATVMQSDTMWHLLEPQSDYTGGQEMAEDAWKV